MSTIEAPLLTQYVDGFGSEVLWNFFEGKEVTYVWYNVRHNSFWYV